MRLVLVLAIAAGCRTQQVDPKLERRVAALEAEKPAERWWYCIARDPGPSGLGSDKLASYTGCMRERASCIDATTAGGGCTPVASAWCFGTGANEECYFARERCDAIAGYRSLTCDRRLP